jgi:hypothetical protein
MPRLSAGNDCFLKVDMTTEEKERFRLACRNASQQTGERWSMARALRAIMKDFSDMWTEAEGDDSGTGHEES